MAELSIRNEPPTAGTEVDALLGSLQRLRGYLLWKCGGLDDVGIRTRLGPSAITLAAGGLDGEASVTDGEGRHANVRRLVLDMIEEYGRHVGHADLNRESIDGLVGEDPPEE